MSPNLQKNFTLLFKNFVGFSIGAVRLLCLDRKEVEEFYEVYRDVVNEYSAMVDELSQGPSLILEIKGNAAADHVQKSFREFCGPADTKVAQENGLNENKLFFKNYSSN